MVTADHGTNAVDAVTIDVIAHIETNNHDPDYCKGASTFHILPKIFVDKVSEYFEIDEKEKKAKLKSLHYQEKDAVGPGKCISELPYEQCTKFEPVESFTIPQKSSHSRATNFTDSSLGPKNSITYSIRSVKAKEYSTRTRTSVKSMAITRKSAKFFPKMGKSGKFHKRGSKSADSSPRGSQLENMFREKKAFLIKQKPLSSFREQISLPATNDLSKSSSSMSDIDYSFPYTKLRTDHKTQTVEEKSKSSFSINNSGFSIPNSTALTLTAAQRRAAFICKAGAGKGIKARSLSAGHLDNSTTCIDEASGVFGSQTNINTKCSSLQFCCSFHVSSTRRKPINQSADLNGKSTEKNYFTRTSRSVDDIFDR